MKKGVIPTKWIGSSNCSIYPHNGFVEIVLECKKIRDYLQRGLLSLRARNFNSKRLLKKWYSYKNRKEFFGLRNKPFSNQYASLDKAMGMAQLLLVRPVKSRNLWTKEIFVRFFCCSKLIKGKVPLHYHLFSFTRKKLEIFLQRW